MMRSGKWSKSCWRYMTPKIILSKNHIYWRDPLLDAKNEQDEDNDTNGRLNFP